MYKMKNSYYVDYIDQKLAAFQNLFNSYYQSLAVYAYKIVDDYQGAEDIVQDVFMALWIKKDILDFNEPIQPYLFKAVYNRSINYLKSQSPIASKVDISTILHNEIIQSDQDETLFLKEISEEIRKFVETLPPQCKTVFKLSRISNMKHREIASTLNISEKTVESHIRKALNDLRTHLKKIGLITLLLWFGCH